MSQTNRHHDDLLAEIQALAQGYADGALDEAQQSRLQQLIAQDDDARRLYIAYMEESFDLIQATRALIAEENAAEQYAAAGLSAAVGIAARRRAKSLTSRPTLISTAVAALVVGAFLTALAFMAAPIYRAMTGASDDPPQPTHRIVAQLTDVHQAAWAEGQVGTRVGGHLPAGQRMELMRGQAVVTHRSGAMVTLDGPCVYVVDDVDAGSLRRGRLVANIPPAAIGFRVATRAATITDLGTQFGVEVAEQGYLSVHVIAGRVLAAPKVGQPRRAVELLAGQSLRFDGEWRTLATSAAQQDRLIALLQEAAKRLDGPLLRVDFQHTRSCRVQPGFWSFTEADAADGRYYPTRQGPLHVGIAGQDRTLGGFFGRNQLANGGGLTNADLYNDFAFANGLGLRDSPQSLTLTFSGSALAPDTDYLLTFYSYDSDSSQGSHSVAYRGISGTTGAAGPLNYTAAVDPTTNDQYAVTGVFTTDSTGVLTIFMEDTFWGATAAVGIRLNACEISPASASSTSETEGDSPN